MKNLFLILLVISTFTFTACSNKTSSGGNGGSENSFIPGKGNNNNEDENRGRETRQPPVGNQGRASCLLRQGTICGEFTGASWNVNSIYQACAQYQGVLNQTACSNQNMILQCALNVNTGDEVYVKYYSPITREIAEQDCYQAGGVSQ